MLTCFLFANNRPHQKLLTMNYIFPLFFLFLFFPMFHKNTQNTPRESPFRLIPCFRVCPRHTPACFRGHQAGPTKETQSLFLPLHKPNPRTVRTPCPLISSEHRRWERRKPSAPGARQKHVAEHRTSHSAGGVLLETICSEIPQWLSRTTSPGRVPFPRDCCDTSTFWMMTFGIKLKAF